MADLSTYSPIYIRTSGNDTTGDGSLAAPFATAQKGFEVASNGINGTGSGNFVLDLGEGVVIGTLPNDFSLIAWPDRIAVRSANNNAGYTGIITGSFNVTPDGDAAGGLRGILFENGIPFTGTATDGRILVAGTAIYEIRNGVTYLDGYIANGFYYGMSYLWWANKYYIGGVATELPESGTGSWGGGYYFGGCLTTLDQNGTGCSQNYSLEGGQCQAFGPTLCYINATLVTGWYDFSGTGWYEFHRYYIGGVETSLLESGTGIWNDKCYVGGQESAPDCNGVCGGSAVVDCGGTCGGSAVVDCGGTCGGSAVVDDCGVCGGNNASKDCAGVCGGSDFWTDCDGTQCGSNFPTDCDWLSCGNNFWTDCDGTQCGSNFWTDCEGTQCGSNNWTDGCWNSCGICYFPEYGWYAVPDCSYCISSGYYINYQLTTLPESGTGWWGDKFWIGGVETTLNESGTGVWDSKQYFSGILAVGWIEPTYYIAGVATTLPESGTGWWNITSYTSGTPTFTINPDGQFCVNGEPLTGDLLAAVSPPWPTDGPWRSSVQFVNGYSEIGNFSGDFPGLSYSGPVFDITVHIVNGLPFEGIRQSDSRFFRYGFAWNGEFNGIHYVNGIASYTGFRSQWFSGITPSGDGAGGMYAIYYRNGIPFTGTTGDGRLVESGIGVYGARNGVTYIDGYLANGWVDYGTWPGGLSSNSTFFTNGIICSAVVDCNSVCGGSAVVDCNGTCNGGAVADCNGTCGGSAVVDDCGVCGGNNESKDCNGTCDGSAVVDILGQCCDGNTMQCGRCNDPGPDCMGHCDRPAENECYCLGVETDDCGVCGGNNASKDCNGECGGSAVVDDCGVCNGGNALKDCNGDCNGSAVVDCNDVCGGGAVLDCNGTCGGGAVADCNGTCGGSAVVDDCGVCGGNNASKDCNGECGGGNFWTDCDGIPCGTNNWTDPCGFPCGPCQLPEYGWYLSADCLSCIPTGFYINYQLTTLPESGTGWWSNKYYIGGTETTLPQSGTGWWSNKYYIGGTETTLPQSGTGWWIDTYYIGGAATTLPESGTGTWEGQQYVNGVVILERNFVPRDNGFGSIGTDLLRWKAGHFSNFVKVAGSPVLTEASSQPLLAAKANLVHTHTVANVTGLQAALDSKQPVGSYQPSGSYATLVGGVVPASQLPSYVDDVLEFANIAAFPATGESGKIYVTTGTNKTYRWSGSAYVEIASSPGSTDAVSEGVNNLYFTPVRAVSALAPTLTNYPTLVNGRVPIEQLTSYLQVNSDGDLEPTL